MHQLAHHGADDQFLCLASSTQPLAEALAPGCPVHGHHGWHVQGFAQEAVADLPINPKVRYYSIMGNDTPDLPLAESSDGVVPYASAHLDGAQSEKVIPSWHSVQESPQAILEIRRILRLAD